jgi:hypothetical protein
MVVETQIDGKTNRVNPKATSPQQHENQVVAPFLLRSVPAPAPARRELRLISAATAVRGETDKQPGPGATRRWQYREARGVAGRWGLRRRLPGRRRGCWS